MYIRNLITAENIDTVTALETAVWRALNLSTGYAAQVQEIKKAYLETLDAAGDFKPVEFVQGVAAAACRWFDAARFQLAEEYGADSESSWTDFEEYKAIQSGFTAFRQSVSRETGGVTFKVTGRVSPAESLQGKTVQWEIDSRQYTAKDEKQETASGKSKSRKAQGAAVPGPEETADAMAHIIGDRELARSVLLKILNAHPELTADSSVKSCYQRNLTKYAKRKAAEKAGTAKQEKAA